LAALVAAPLLASASPSLEVRQSQRITVDITKQYQTMDGFGSSAAFQRANLIVNLQAPKQREVLDFLFNMTTGAGFSILRNGIGSTPNSNSDFMNTILPKCPSTPAEVTTNYSGYVWDGKDSGQVFLSQRAQEYGINTFYADIWSAPGSMKTNNKDTNGGQLCGVCCSQVALIVTDPYTDLRHILPLRRLETSLRQLPRRLHQLLRLIWHQSDASGFPQ
jgi:O-glycosyl hydrolase